MPSSGTVLTDEMNVIYLSIEKETGKVVKRVYRSKENHKYYTDPDFSEAYTLPGTEEIRNYGWVAVPLPLNLNKVRWKPGYQYSYTLDYSSGVGVHAPDEPLPGYPIISKILVGVTEDNQTWPMVVDDFTAGSGVDVTDGIIIK